MIDLLETTEVERAEQHGPFRFPVQLVCRPRTEAFPDYRGYQGRIENGSVSIGDSIVVLPAGRKSSVKRIEFFHQELTRAVAGQSVTIHLEEDLDVSRGDLIAGITHAPTIVNELTATLCWFSEQPLEPSSRLLLRHGTQLVRARVQEILSRLDLHTLEPQAVSEVRMNDIATLNLQLQTPIAPDAHGRVRSGGSFILIDEISNSTVGAGLVLEPEYLAPHTPAAVKAAETMA